VRQHASREIPMQLQQNGANQTVLLTDHADILFSYNTPVAALIPGRGYVRTATYYSPTTSRHIKSWLGGAACVVVPQSFLDTLLDERN